MWWGRRVSPIGLLGAILWAGAASAEPAVESAHLAYLAIPPCPSQQDFERAVRERTRRWTSASRESAHRVFSVSLSNEGEEWTGRLQVQAGGETPTMRTVSGGSCEEVADAMALVVAVAIDPRRSLAVESVEEPEPAGEMTTPEPPVVARPGPVGEPKAPVARWRAGLGAQVALHGGPAPEPMWTVPLFFEWCFDRHQSPDPLFRVSVGRGALTAASLLGSSARFSWTFARVEGCAAWQVGDFRLAPCAMVEGGALRGAGQGVDVPRAKTRPWFVAGLVGRGQWVVTPGLFVEGQASLGTPLVRDRFYLEPDTTVHDVAYLTWGGAIGLGAHFP
jgi:hypothetical protein